MKSVWGLHWLLLSLYRWLGQFTAHASPHHTPTPTMSWAPTPIQSWAMGLSTFLLNPGGRWCMPGWPWG